MNRKIQMSKPIAALYCRLSIDDGNGNESISISNQKAMLKDYAEKNGMFDYEYYIDDGFTGRNFNRPAFQRMITDIENGKVSCVITKDLSRLGRNYIEAGTYIEVYFPRKNVRYIAVADGVDSLNQQEIDITPFKNILNDMYSRDISKKVKAGWLARSRQGKFCGGPPPYGLMRDPKNSGHLIIDPKTAPNVKVIYDLALEGYGNQRISKYLMEHKIPITRCKTPEKPDLNHYFWGCATIGKILRNPVYKGDHIVCKTHQKAIRSNTFNFIPRDQWEIIENCHEPIISKEDWNRVQKIIDSHRMRNMENTCPFHNLFRGLLFCETCGKYMELKYEKVGRKDIDRTTKKKREPIDKAFYVCQTYNKMGKKACTNHKIEARDLYNLALEDIVDHAKMAFQDSEAFYIRLTNRLEEKYSCDEAALKREMEVLLKRDQEIDTLYMNLYEDKAKGFMTEQRFLKMTDALEKEQTENKEQINKIAEKLQTSESKTNKIRHFVEEIKKYVTITELDDAILNRLIDRITIGEIQIVDGEKIQKITIRYNFVGEIPN